jgi:hypothetical protein
LNLNGVLQWNTFLGQSGHDYGHDIARAGDGTLYMAGTSFGTWGSPIRAYTPFSSDGFIAAVSISQIYLPVVIK